MTEEFINAVKELIKDYDEVLHFPLGRKDGEEKSGNQIAFHNGSYVIDFHKNKKIILKELEALQQLK